MRVKFGFKKVASGQQRESGEAVMSSAVITKWHKRVGDKVEKGEPILHFETDKVDMDLESPCKGVITKISEDYTGDGSVWEINTGLGSGGIEEVDGNILHLPHLGFIETDQPEADITSPESRTEPKVAAENREPRRRITPLARKIARANGILEEQLSGLKGSGPADSIVVRDVKEYLKSDDAKKVPVLEIPHDRVLLDVPLIRKTIARLTEKSWREIPHAGDAVEVNMSKLRDFRERHKKLWLAATGTELRYDLFFMYIAVKLLTLDAFRILNGYWDQDKKDGYTLRDINMGLAVQTPRGLTVPVLHKAQEMSFLELAKAMEDKIARAMSGKIQISDLRDLTFTVNNTGLLGGKMPHSTIPYVVESDGSERPSAAILSLGRIDWHPSAHWYLNMVIRFDHRLLDGAEALGFLLAIKRYMESKQSAEEFEELLDPNFSISG